MWKMWKGYEKDMQRTCSGHCKGSATGLHRWCNGITKGIQREWKGNGKDNNIGNATVIEPSPPPNTSFRIFFGFRWLYSAFLFTQDRHFGPKPSFISLFAGYQMTIRSSFLHFWEILQKWWHEAQNLDFICLIKYAI